ncbi:MAG: two-CW domain-containing protein [Planctomycetota bacterium]|jgi:rsbT co-antagonist protein RsbR
MEVQNCWEFKKCGREPNGGKVSELGVCPVAETEKAQGLNRGDMGGRACWAVAGTFCGGQVQGTFAKKFHNCLVCDFYKKVLVEEGKEFQGTRAVLSRLGHDPGMDSESSQDTLILGLAEIFDVLVRISEGDYSAQAPEKGENEILNSLGATVNGMTGAVRDSFDRLNEANEKLIQTHDIIMSLSTPVIQVWDGVLALPLIGVLDSQRAQQAMEVVLDRVIAEKAKIVILDITGVPLVDSLVANHLAQTMTAVKLIGAEGVLTGISANVAQTLVKLGADVSDIETRSTLSEGLKYALKKTGVDAEAA